MVATGFAWSRVLHLLAVGVALGSLATLPVLRSRVHKVGDSRFATYGLEAMARIERWILAPASLGVLVFGLAMVEGPVARYDFTAPGAGWLHWGTTMWLILAIGVGTLFHLRGQLVEKAQLGATGGQEVDKLWRYWTLAWGVAVGSLVGGVLVMAWKLGA